MDVLTDSHLKFCYSSLNYSKCTTLVLTAEARYCDSITWVLELPISTFSLNILEAYDVNLSITIFSKGNTLSTDPKLLILEFYFSNSTKIYQSSFSLIASSTELLK